MRQELAAAFMLLTRLPVRAFAGSPPEQRNCLWAYPLVGAAIGAIAAAAYALLDRAGAPPLLAASWALAASVLVTGALHEDGLADLADGFGGGSTVARKLEIMRDSRVGSYGVLALLIAALMRVAAVAALATPARVIPGLIVAGALSRGAMAVPVLLLQPARADGLASGLRDRDPHRALLAPALGVVAAIALLPASAAAEIVLAAAAAALGLSALARKQVGGYTGDVLGACAVLVECAVLTALAAA